jgi:hypothetical protein
VYVAKVSCKEDLLSVLNANASQANKQQLAETEVIGNTSPVRYYLDAVSLVQEKVEALDISVYDLAAVDVPQAEQCLYVCSEQIKAKLIISQYHHRH